MLNEHVRSALLLAQKRATGKSTVLAEGIANYSEEFILVCRTVQEGRRLTRNNSNAIYLCPPEALRSPHPDVPIVFDQEEVKGYLWTIADQEEEISSLKLQVEALQQNLEENGNTR